MTVTETHRIIQSGIDRTHPENNETIGKHVDAFKSDVEAVRKKFDDCQNKYNDEKRKLLSDELNEVYKKFHPHLSTVKNDSQLIKTASSLADIFFMLGRLRYADSSLGKKLEFARSGKMFELSFLLNMMTVREPQKLMRVLNESFQENDLLDLEYSRRFRPLLQEVYDLFNENLSVGDLGKLRDHPILEFKIAETMRYLGFCLQNHVDLIAKLKNKNTAKEYINLISNIYNSADSLYRQINSPESNVMLCELTYNTAPFRYRLQVIRDYYDQNPNVTEISDQKYTELWNSRSTLTKALATWDTLLKPHFESIKKDNPIMVRKWTAQISNNTAYQWWTAFKYNENVVRNNLADWYQKVSHAIEIVESHPTKIGDEFLEHMFYARRAELGLEAFEGKIDVKIETRRERFAKIGLVALAIITSVAAVVLTGMLLVGKISFVAAAVSTPILVAIAVAAMIYRKKFHLYPTLEEVKRDIDKAVAFADKNSHAYNGDYYAIAGRVYLQLGDHKKCIEYFQKAR